MKECIDKYLDLSKEVFRVDQVLAGHIPTGDDPSTMTFSLPDLYRIFSGSFHPTKLALIQVWLCLEIYEGAVVGVDFKVSSKEKGSPTVEGVHYRAHFFVMHWIISLMRIELL